MRQRYYNERSSCRKFLSVYIPKSVSKKKKSLSFKSGARCTQVPNIPKKIEININRWCANSSIVLMISNMVLTNVGRFFTIFFVSSLILR